MQTSKRTAYYILSNVRFDADSRRGSQIRLRVVRLAVMDHDFEQQKQETFWVWDDIRKSNPDLPSEIDLDIQFIPSSSKSNGAVLKTALEEIGFEVVFYQDDPTVEAKMLCVEASAEAIWEQEQQASQIALSYGFKPDGWGFMSGS